VRKSTVCIWVCDRRPHDLRVAKPSMPVRRPCEGIYLPHMYIPAPQGQIDQTKAVDAGMNLRVPVSLLCCR
jgi:hypothetical protein